MGLKTIKIEWDLCSNPPWVWFYHYTMFPNPMPQPSCQKSRKTIITQKVLVRQSSHIVHCDWHSQKPICTDFQAFLYTFPYTNWHFFIFFCLVEWSKQPKISHFVDFDWEKCIEHGLSGVFLGFEACQIQWCRFWVSTISGSLKIKI